MNSLVIAGTNIRRDAEGRYSLNDLHRASGGEQKDRPKYWAETEQSRRLVNVLDSKGGKSPLVATHGGSDPGTYGVEQLAVAYAAWISPEFHLEVIDTFLVAKKEVVRRASRTGITEDVARDFRALKSIARTAGLTGNPATIAAAQGTEKLTGINPLVLIGQVHLIAAEPVRHYTPTELGKEMSESGQAFNRRLERAGLQVKNIQGDWQPTEAGAPFGVLLDTGKKHGNGTPIQQWKWLHTVLDHLTDPEAA